jgi:GT2 family glycosyltransferase
LRPINRAKPKIGILVLNQNGQQWLPTIYHSIREQSYPQVKMYLVDNASTDASVEWTQKEYPKVTILRMPSNLGYCMAYNLAMKQAFADQCDWVIWANNDVKLEAGCLAALVEAVQSDARIGVAGPAFLSWEKDEPNYYIVGNYPEAIPAMENRSPKPMDVEWVEGSFLMLSQRCIKAVGPLDPYLYFYWEEADFCRRARYQGWRVVLVPKALARHYAGGWSSGNKENLTEADQLKTRNYYIYKLANPSQPFMKNILEAFHLFFFSIKISFKKPSSTIAQLKIFGKVLKEINHIYWKWIRDRRGGHPPDLRDGFSLQGLEVIQIRGKN